MKENVAVINQINEQGSQTASAAERPTKGTHSHRQVEGQKTGLHLAHVSVCPLIKNIWIVITPCFLTLQ